ncbi:hypothetical protein SG34_003980 [Thalassomonas viridans]|uniref:Uncharacterized protein n=1 Tax=Thalassomonas viridans TaxID=137584 RepID=A0AAE9Z6D0_9GAMM|nr:hypothetical protein [Thalassomonas viridans]WDE06098.1 hypothetical protein SG34_003980 [Thalassomonas viridans]
MSFLSITLLWAGCLLPYLSSEKQQLIDKPLSKALGWSGFVLALIGALVLQAQQQGYLVASISILAAVMCMWTVLVLAAPYISKRRILISSDVEKRLVLASSLGIAFFSLIAMTGSFHVA